MNVRSIFIRKADGSLHAAYYPNAIGRTVAELIAAAEVEAETIGGTVQINREGVAA